MNTKLLEKTEFHSFHWDNFSPEILQAHKKVMSYFGLNVKYTQKNIPHGQWLDEIMASASADVIAIIEPDLIPLNLEIVLNAIEYVTKNDTFLGCAQVSNHIGTGAHIFASPSFFFITKNCYEKLGRPSFMPNKQGDVAEILSYTAESKGITYRTLFPTRFEKAPSEGCWALGSYGYYGIGTVFADQVYHLFQSRHAKNIELFVKRCNELLNNQLDISSFTLCTDFQTPENIYKSEKKSNWYTKLLKKIKAF
ncbi:hypothetical protein [Acinetobacter sp. MD2(2019)]|uniref:hypothetical protein n=1 Tax=Acinetobacter sp. MD2(2019) TaxID=2605273 RepID=UPI002D1F172B|nr:hypothetical protein [Acinetobacter sp. MD2(2019)]MEB3754270.1 hypothetical protein [Acinetobacter sp. MD2(2019)]